MSTLILLSLFLTEPPPPVALERLGRLDHPPIREASGFVKSRRFPDLYWTHNDSGNPPALFAVRRDGTLVREYSVGAPNVDWEDIATDDRGHLYLGEIGNNFNRLPLRAVYQIDEPDPSAKGEPDKLPVKGASYYRFPAEGRFDAEGLVVGGGRALIVAKTFDRRAAEIYAIPLDPPAPLFRPAVAERVGTLAGFTEPVTGADLSPDGRRLVVCSVGAFGVFETDGRDGWKPLALRSFRSDNQTEAVAWDGDDILLAGEGRGILRVKKADWRSGEPRGPMADNDVVIVGGGVIGLSVAYRLACAGVASTVVDRGELGREASWAGAGLIPANTERLRTNPSAELRSWSAVLYPEWSAALREETGIDNGYRRTGGVDVAFTVDGDRELRSSAGRWRAEGIVFERLAPADFRRVEPALNADLLTAYFLPDRAQVRNPRHLRALASASAKRGVALRPGEGVVGFKTTGDCVSAVETTSGVIACGTVVVTAGAWTGGLLLGALGVRAPTPPLKGQIVLLKGDPNRPYLKRIIEHGKNYLVPRDDGRILIGATEEDAGFDTRPTRFGVRSLLNEASRLCPVLADAEVEMSWAGLRPGTIDSRPYIGGVPGYANVFVAAGHKRAGLQLSPATAELVVDLVLGRPPGIDLSPFRVGRDPAAADDEAFRS